MIVRYKPLVEFAQERTAHLALLGQELGTRIRRYARKGALGYVESGLAAIDAIILKLGGAPTGALAMGLSDFGAYEDEGYPSAGIRP